MVSAAVPVELDCARCRFEFSEWLESMWFNVLGDLVLWVRLRSSMIVGVVKIAVALCSFGTYLWRTLFGLDGLFESVGNSPISLCATTLVNLRVCTLLVGRMSHSES